MDCTHLTLLVAPHHAVHLSCDGQKSAYALPLVGAGLTAVLVLLTALYVHKTGQLARSTARAAQAANLQAQSTASALAAQTLPLLLKGADSSLEVKVTPTQCRWEIPLSNVGPGVATIDRPPLLVCDGMQREGRAAQVHVPAGGTTRVCFSVDQSDADWAALHAAMLRRTPFDVEVGYVTMLGVRPAPFRLRVEHDGLRWSAVQAS